MLTIQANDIDDNQQYMEHADYNNHSGKPFWTIHANVIDKQLMYNEFYTDTLWLQSYKLLQRNDTFLVTQTETNKKDWVYHNIKH